MTRKVLAFIEAESITGPAKNLLQLTTMLEQADFEPKLRISVATFVRNGRPPNVFLERAREEGIESFAVAEERRFDRKIIHAVRDLVNMCGPDIVQTHATKSHFLCRLAQLQVERPWVAFHHGYTWPDLRARVYNELDRWSLRAASRVVTVSKPFRQELIERGVKPERIEIVHNAVAAGWGNTQVSPHELKGELGIAPTVPVLLSVGRLSREKDHFTLLNALQRLRSAHLVIVGDGPERSRIEALPAARGLVDRVSLVGHKPSAEPYYAIADVVVLSSLSEGSPNALLEAMAAGVPAVCTRVGGVPEIVSDRETALLVDPSDAAAMAEAVSTLLSNAGLARSVADRARQNALQFHSPEVRMRRLWSIYADMLTASGGTSAGW